MTTEERAALEKEWSEINERTHNAQFVDPRDMRRKDEITSLLMTDGQSSTVKFNFLRGRRSTKGMNTKGYNDHGGKTGF